MVRDYTVSLLSQKPLGNGIHFLTFRQKELASALRPGQFVQVLIDSRITYLRRPFSICRVQGSDVGILYKIKGKGTEALSCKKKGDTLTVLGPLGKGFTSVKSIGHTYPRIFVVAGGMGIAPLMFLLDSLKPYKKKVEVFYGACTKSELVLRSELAKMGFPIAYATDDCSFGLSGRITHLLEQRKRDCEDEKVFVYSCGPEAMYRSIKNVYGLPAKGVTVEALFERMMGCGFGVCNSCSIMTTGGMKKVCTDGPAFDLSEIVFE